MQVTLTVTVGVATFSLETVIHVASGPNVGSCAVNPASGIAMTTFFTVTCRDWEGTGLVPVTYNMGYTDSNGRDVPLSVTSHVATAAHVLPPNARLFVAVRDSRGATRVDLNVEV